MQSKKDNHQSSKYLRTSQTDQFIFNILHTQKNMFYHIFIKTNEKIVKIPKKRKRGAGLQCYRKNYRPGNARMRIEKSRANSNFDNCFINTIDLDKKHEELKKKGSSF